MPQDNLGLEELEKRLKEVRLALELCQKNSWEVSSDYLKQVEKMLKTDLRHLKGKGQEE